MTCEWDHDHPCIFATQPAPDIADRLHSAENKGRSSRNRCLRIPCGGQQRRVHDYIAIGKANQRYMQRVMSHDGRAMFQWPLSESWRIPQGNYVSPLHP